MIQTPLAAPPIAPQTVAAMLAWLDSNDIGYRVGPSGELQLRDPAGRLTEADRVTIRLYRDPIADWLTTTRPASDEAPKHSRKPAPGAPRCTRCDSTDFHEVTIHQGASLRRDCARCGLTWGFPVWHGAGDCELAPRRAI